MCVAFGGVSCYDIDIDIVEFLLRAYRQWRTVKSAGSKSARLKRSLQQNGVSYAVEISSASGFPAYIDIDVESRTQINSSLSSHLAVFIVLLFVCVALLRQ